MKCLVWGTGIIYSQNINILKYYELLGNIKIVGVTSNNMLFAEVLGYPSIYKENIKDVFFDVVIVMGEGKVFREIVDDAMEIGIDKWKMISYKVFQLPGFNLVKYLILKKNPPTIFANNCWGGLTYHKLGLEFTSPFINMFESDSDYLKLLIDPGKYMNCPLELQAERFDPILQRNYPVCRCDDILLYFNHYTSFDEANSCWEKRKERINWKNLFVMMITEDQEIAKQFSNLPYAKKICFIPFPMKEHSMFYVDFYAKCNREKFRFSEIVNGMASGAYPYYDTIQLINNCEVVKISK